MPTKQFKVQLTQTLPNPAVVTIQVNGNIVFNNSITSEATFNLDVTDTPAEGNTVQNWSIAVSGSPITISGILNNYSSTDAEIPTIGPGIVLGSSFLDVAGLIVSQPTYNGQINTSLYDINSYIRDGAVTGVGALPIPNNEICVFDLQVENWTEHPSYSPTINYAVGNVAVYNLGYYVNIQSAAPGTPPTDTNYWAPIENFG